MSSTEIKLNKEQANYGIEQLKQCQRELYEADKLFYKGIMALASAKGMDLILKEDAGINLYMPEKIVIECREEVATLIEEISSKLALVQDFNEEPKEGTDTVQYRKTGTGEEVVKAPGAQPLYGVPTPESPIEGGITGPIQALYAPPGIEPNMPVQPMYGVITPSDPVVQPMYGVITPSDPIVQPMYGVITPSDPIVGPIEGGVVPGPIQALYVPPGIPDPNVGNPGIPDPGIGTPTTPEYETIPNTGIPGVIEKNYVSKHPRLIGGLAATIGLFGIPTMLSDDFDEEEEKRLNGKED